MQDDINHFKKVINDLNLDSTINRLVDIEKWSRIEALEAVKQYKNYLFLKKKYGNQFMLPPSKDIDEVWHAHILHTEEYLDFCENVYGKFLHHSPHSKDCDGQIMTSQQLSKFFEEQTQRLYYKEFGEYIYAIRPIAFAKKINLFLKKIFLILKSPKSISLVQ